MSLEIPARRVVASLQHALTARQPAAGLIHHSDQGLQYAYREYVFVLQTAGGRLGMSGKIRTRVNAQAETFMRTLKHGEVYLAAYQSSTEARARIGCFIRNVYNPKRLQSSFGYRSPSELEQLLAAGFLL